MNRSVIAALVPLVLMGCSVSSSGGQSADASSTDMVAIDGGLVWVGTDNDTYSDAPIKQVVIPTFRIDAFEVTNSQFADCVSAGKCPEPGIKGFDQIPDYYESDTYADAPVAYVTWYQAGAYCAWQGKRLPTELEWEAAARGADGNIYPWGDAEPTCDYAHYGECNQVREAGTGPMAVGSLEMGATEGGVYDLAGNMAEWTADWYDDDLYNKFVDGEMPIRPEAGRSKVIRGGSWYCEADRMLSFKREAFPPVYRAGNVGFRCAESI